MKKRNLKKFIFVMSLIVTILVAGCGKSENTKQAKEETKVEEETTEGQTEESPTEEDSEGEDTNGDSSKKSAGQAISYIEYKDEYSEIPFDEMEDVSENGNPYDFDTSLLGYYTNGYIGFNFYQVDGDFIKTDFFAFDYYVGSGTVDVMSPTTVSFVYTAENTYGSVDTDGVFATTDTADTNIDLSSGSFTLNTTNQLGQWINNTMLQDTMALFYPSYQPEEGVSCYSYSLGKYDKKDDSYIKDSLKTINSYIAGTEGCYYENNQPKKDRMSMEQYPIYAKNVPEEGYYLYSYDGKNPTRAGADFVLAKVETTNENLQGCTQAIAVTLNSYHWFDEIGDGSWSMINWTDNNNSSSFNNRVGHFVNFNYEIPEYVYIGEVGGELQDNEADEQGYLFDYKITMIVNDDGTLSFKSNREGEMTDLIGHLATAPCPFPSDVKLKKVDQSVIDAIEMPAEYSLP